MADGPKVEGDRLSTLRTMVSTRVAAIKARRSALHQVHRPGR